VKLLVVETVVRVVGVLCLGTGVGFGIRSLRRCDRARPHLPRSHRHVPACTAAGSARRRSH